MITGTALSRRPLERIEIIINGRVHTIIEPTNRSTPAGGYETTLGVAVAPKGSHWIAVRCFEQHPQGRVRFAHTNPVFGDVDGQPLRPRQVEVEYFIDRMEQEIESNRDVLSAEALDEYRQALDAYREIAKTAR